MQLYEDIRKPFNEFEIRLRSTQRGPTLGHQTIDACGDLSVILRCLALGRYILIMSRHSGYIRNIEPHPRAQSYICDISLLLGHSLYIKRISLHTGVFFQLTTERKTQRTTERTTERTNISPKKCTNHISTTSKVIIVWNEVSKENLQHSHEDWVRIRSNHEVP